MFKTKDYLFMFIIGKAYKPGERPAGSGRRSPGGYPPPRRNSYRERSPPPPPRDYYARDYYERDSYYRERDHYYRDRREEDRYYTGIIFFLNDKLYYFIFSFWNLCHCFNYFIKVGQI